MNKYGIPEPIKSEIKIPNIILVPLLAYDKNKNRLGYGKGFYDKYLNQYFKMHKKILSIGIAFSFQRYHKLPINEKDYKLDYIITEKGIFDENLNFRRCYGSIRKKCCKKILPNFIQENKINFSVINGENAADDGKGITKEIADDFFSQGVDVITSGNHIWDKDETTNYIENEKDFLDLLIWPQVHLEKVSESICQKIKNLN